MKNLAMSLFLLAGLIGTAQASRQGVPDFLDVSTPTVNWVTYSSWSNIMGSTSVFYSRVGIMIDHVNQNTKDIMIQITTSNVAPASTFYGYTMTETSDPWILSTEKSRYIWAITTDILQQVIVQELE